MPELVAGSRWRPKTGGRAHEFHHLADRRRRLWLARKLDHADHAQQGIILNIVVGIVGAFIAGLLFGGGASLNNGFTIETFLWSLLGAVILLAIVNLIRRGTVR